MAEAKLELTGEEKTSLQQILKTMPREEFKEWLERLSMAIRSFKGEPIEPDDIFSGLLNIKRLEERTRFNTKPHIILDTYLRLVNDFCPEAKAFKQWGDQLAEDWIAYQGLNRVEAIEMAKAKGIQQSQGTLVFGMQPQMQEGPKGRLAKIKEKFKRSKEEPLEEA